MTTTTPAPVRFWAKVDRGDECWLWTGGLDGKGYGQFRINSQCKIVAHRFAYELLVGPIADGMQLDHLCRVRNCVNPEHLEPVTGRENTLRGEGPTAEHARRTHCPRNHLYDEGNTRMDRGRRRCKACDRERDAKRRDAAQFGGE